MRPNILRARNRLSLFLMLIIITMTFWIVVLVQPKQVVTQQQTLPNPEHVFSTNLSSWYKDVVFIEADGPVRLHATASENTGQHFALIVTREELSELTSSQEEPISFLQQINLELPAGSSSLQLESGSDVYLWLFQEDDYGFTVLQIRDYWAEHNSLMLLSLILAVFLSGPIIIATRAKA